MGGSRLLTAVLLSALVLLFAFPHCAHAWIFNEDNGDVVMQGPIAIEPSFGQDASVQLKRNSTTFWSLGNNQHSLHDNSFYIRNAANKHVASISQQGHFSFASVLNETKCKFHKVGPR